MMERLPRISAFWCLHTALLIAALAGLNPAFAEQPQRPKVPSNQPSQQMAQPGQMPDIYRLNMLIRNTVIALNQANATGNYTVLRDLGTPGFRHANDAARMGITFAALRAKEADLSPVFFVNPVLMQPAAIGGDGLLRMTGYFPTRPQRIAFDVSFQSVDGKWQLAALAVDISPAPEEAVSPQAAQKGPALKPVQNAAPPAPAGGRLEPAMLPKSDAYAPAAPKANRAGAPVAAASVPAGSVSNNMIIDLAHGN
jgi:hypothetical protein